MSQKLRLSISIFITLILVLAGATLVWKASSVILERSDRISWPELFSTASYRSADAPLQDDSCVLCHSEPLRFAQGQAPAKNPVDDSGIPTEFTFQDQTIPLLWTDDNTNENLIIQTDRRYYDGHNQSFVYLSITNTTNQAQETNIYFWFDDTDKGVKFIKKIDPNNSGTTATGTVPETASSGEDAVSGTVPVQRKDIKGYTAGTQFQDTIQPNQTNFYQAVITYPAKSQGEFFIEAFGYPLSLRGANEVSDEAIPRKTVFDGIATLPSVARNDNQIGYGHLDPYFASGLVGYWSFDAGDMDWSSSTAEVLDRSGQGNRGNVTNFGQEAVRDGISAQALDFNGSDDYVDCGDSSSLNSIGAKTVVTWIYPHTWYAYARIISEGDGGDGSYILSRGNSTGAILAQYRYNSATYNRSADFPVISLNTWQHIVFTFDGVSIAKIYVDGVRVDDAVIGGFGYGNSVNLNIGRRNDGTNYYDGLIDEVRIYNRALSASEILELYRVGTARLKIRAPSASGLVGYWSFDAGDMDWYQSSAEARDRSGQGNHGNVVDFTATSTVDGIISQALDFNGSDDYVDVAYDASLNGMGELSVAAWVYPRTWGSAEVILRKGVTELSYQLVAPTTNKLRFRVDTSGTDTLDTTADLSTDTWTHVVATYDGTTMKIYLNGVENVSKTHGSGGNVETGTESLDIGKTGAGDPFNGTIDEVRIYNRALSASEILELYRVGTARLKIRAPSASGLVGYWSFDAGDMDWYQSSAEARDRSGQGNHGNVVDFTATSTVDGMVSQALEFNGDDDYVSVSESSGVATSGNDWTYTAWIKTYDNSLTYQGIYNEGETSEGNEDETTLWMVGDKVQYRTRDTEGGSSTRFTINSQTTIQNDVWYFVAITTASKNNHKLYVNGVEENSSTDTLQTLNIEQTTIGARYEYVIGREWSFNGTIDEVRIYNRALSAAEILDLYRAGKGRIEF